MAAPLVRTGSAKLSSARSSYTARSVSARAPARSVAARMAAAAVMSPERPAPVQEVAAPVSADGPTVSVEAVRALEAELDTGRSVAALRRFNDALAALPSDVGELERRMEPVWAEFAYNLESFNAVFTAVLLKVQLTIGVSDYVRRDEALQGLIQPLAGEYGLHAAEPMGKTHRKLFSEFYTSVTGKALPELIRGGPSPDAAAELFAKMMSDVSNGGFCADAVEEASYAMGYNLAVEYLAAPEKQWMLDSFKALSERVLAPAGRDVEWLFLEVHADGEPEHAAIGHQAVTTFVPEAHLPILKRAIEDHDRDFAAFYNHLAELLEQSEE
mmetsp:Transcript_14649/g.48079  ORF Transcript_14649/g.48079 Transcript_14649/m.48079 type:complete len:328 (+) Transcript_14649:18-1001(+)|eukprot:CAMPEP_0170143140 /NCGR_PEP_ID=MMETSP0033_2-20121228/9447_1 /TAXON_ID=195969 /ORGANISM="Dolichomastix tenuilepis, Strain CCMP3274" /LENGTH=327 /DNA_ID=CAMNT_0010379567 /DNA_START=17 /DNA_END=1000 /DNA_ORIENTATION=-